MTVYSPHSIETLRWKPVLFTKKKILIYQSQQRSIRNYGARLEPGEVFWFRPGFPCFDPSLYVCPKATSHGFLGKERIL